MSNLLFFNCTERYCSEDSYHKYFDADFPVNEALSIMHFAVEDNHTLDEVSKCFWTIAKHKYENQNGRTVEKTVYNEEAIKPLNKSIPLSSEGCPSGGGGLVRPRERTVTEGYSKGNNSNTKKGRPKSP